jgi:hypothetical protein
MNIADAIESLQAFTGDGLTSTISNIESQFGGASGGQTPQMVDHLNATARALTAAATIKTASAQIDTAIHALGILRCLEHMLEDGELIDYLSLGAGNTNRRFDLETDRRVVEFKFINWQGGSETVRQNSLFKDFANLAEYQRDKLRQLCVLGDQHPFAFLTRRRTIASVCSNNSTLLGLLNTKYPDIAVVHEYYDLHADRVTIVDVSSWLPELTAMSAKSGKGGHF